MAERKMIPPDGGWGWAIAIAYGLNNVIMVPILQSFSLVLKDVFKKLNMAATDSTIILSVNSAFGMGVGLVHGPLLRKFGYRKIALLGSMLFTIGITTTAFATTFTHFMIFYGLMASFGVGLAMSSFSLAINTYFLAKRGRAVGMAMTFTGLGPILMPQLISYLMSSYGTQGTIIIIGGMTLHSLIGTSLLQPVKWHATWQPVEPQNEQSNAIKVTASKDPTTARDKEDNNITIESENESREKEPLANVDRSERKKINLVRSRSKTLSSPTNHSGTGERALPYKWWSSGKSLETVNLGSSTMIFDENVNYEALAIAENDHETKRSSPGILDASSKETPLLVDEKFIPEKSLEAPSLGDKLSDRKKVDVSCWKNLWRSIVRFFDLGLLRDPIYVNMMMGMSIAQFAEINFAVLTPFILGDMGFDNDEIANVLSTLAGIDLVSRGTVPFIGECLRLSARHMALISLFLLICCRTMLILTRNFALVIVISIGMGFAKGIRSVNMSLVIPNHIPIERLASATGIQMVVNGIVLMMLGPLLGLSRDKFGTFVPCLIIINATTTLAIIMWITEMYIMRRRTTREKRFVQG